MSKKILIIEDEKRIVDILVFNLKREGFEALAVYDGEEGLKAALSESPDLILLDVMLPKKDGFEVCREIRAVDNIVPVLMLTARDEERDKVYGLECGADDYITKPFSIKELIARVKANMRRTLREQPAAESGEVMDFGALSIHTGHMSVTLNGEICEVSQREYELLLYLAKRPGAVVSREELMKNVWNYNYVGEDLRSVDVAVRRLREKIEKNPAEPVFILTRRGAGYLFAGNS